MTEFRFNDEFKITPVKRFDDLRKEIEVHNATVFNDKNVNSSLCSDILINLIYLLNQGEKFSKQEKETLFFSVTKLFHSHDPELRRLIFLFVKHLEFYENSFILTGSLIAEINKPDQILKPNCYRLIGQIVDSSSVSVVERLLKTAISSKSQDISSSAIMCTLYMAHKGFNIAKSWITEISEKLTTSVDQPNLLTFHTLLLLKEIRESDKLFMLKTYFNLTQTNIKSQFATCQLIRYIIDVMKRGDIEDQKIVNAYNTYLEHCLVKQQHESVFLEAARGVLELPKPKESLFNLAMTSLSRMLGNMKKVIRFAVLKTLDKAASKCGPQLSLDLFLDLEKIIDDQSNNASMKAIALSIFLKISKGLSDHRLEKMFKTIVEQYTTFKEEFKKEIVVISKSISRENTTKNKIYFNFFTSLIKLESSLQTKMEILDGISWFIYNDKDLKKSAILCLAEYIEDCQFDNVKTKILHILGTEGPSGSASSQLVRYIYNRIILENATVRAAAISALGEIAYRDLSMRTNILNLIRRSLNDPDNEVRERAFFYAKALQKCDEKSDDEGKKIVDYLFKREKKLDVNLIQNLLKYQKETLFNSPDIAKELSGTLKDPEKLSKIMLNINQNLKKEEGTKTKEGTKKTEKLKGMTTTSTEAVEIDGDEYKKTVFYKSYGQPKLISKTIKLTDQTAEYYTTYRKMIHDKIVVLDFEVTNTIELQVIKNVTIEVTNISPQLGFDLSKSEIIEIDKLDYSESKHLFFKLTKKEDEVYPGCSFNIILKFDLQELDVKGNLHGSPIKEQYKIDKKVEIQYSDYFLTHPKVNLSNYEDYWKMCEKSNFHSAEEKIQLPFPNIKAAGKNFSQIIGFEPLNDLDKIDPTAKKYEFVYAMLNLFDSVVFVRLQVINQGNACLARIIIRAQEKEISDMIVNKIYS